MMREIKFDLNIAKNAIIIYVAIMAVFVAIILVSCTSVKSIDWANVVQQVQFYKDQIPPEYIDQLEEIFKNLK